MKLSEMTVIPLKDWRLKDLQEAEPDLPYTIRYCASDKHFFVLGDGEPEYHHHPAGYVLVIDFGDFFLNRLIFESFTSLPIWAQAAWRALENRP